MGLHIQPVDVDAQPGIMIFDGQNRLIRVMALDIVEDAVLSVRSVINPDTLAHLGPLLALAWRPRHSETGD
jgi:RNA polymerase sigma-70 factor (ECF subfamily)